MLWLCGEFSAARHFRAVNSALRDNAIRFGSAQPPQLSTVHEADDRTRGILIPDRPDLAKRTRTGLRGTFDEAVRTTARFATERRPVSNKPGRLEAATRKAFGGEPSRQRETAVQRRPTHRHKSQNEEADVKILPNTS
jgi:hypothetical protein